MIKADELVLSGSFLAALHYIVDLSIVAELCSITGDTAGSKVLKHPDVQIMLVVHRADICPESVVLKMFGVVRDCRNTTNGRRR